MELLVKPLVVFEGYDGSGKTSLIEALRAHTCVASRVVGRKAEPELAVIAGILEREDMRPTADGEMLLRIAVEVERARIIARSAERRELVICDRGIVSMLSWFDYLDVTRKPYETLIRELLRHYESAVTVVCQADFDTCWRRSSSRPDCELSRKDRLGMEMNRRYFAQYEANLRRFAETAGDVVFVDTANSDIVESTRVMVDALQARGLLSSLVE
jgi:thymidylate kinase